MLVALFAVPVLGREFGAWRADGTAHWGPGGFTSRDTESTNTGFMPHDYLTTPTSSGRIAGRPQDAFPWGIFWTSQDVNEADITLGVGPRRRASRRCPAAWRDRVSRTIPNCCGDSC